MRVIFVISAFVGGIFLLATLVGGVVTVFDSWRGRALRRVPVQTVDDLLRGARHVGRRTRRGAALR